MQMATMTTADPGRRGRLIDGGGGHSSGGGVGGVGDNPTY